MNIKASIGKRKNKGVKLDYFISDLCNDWKCCISRKKIIGIVSGLRKDVPNSTLYLFSVSINRNYVKFGESFQGCIYN